LGQPKPGDTVVVSGAAGAVGQVVGQIAKLAGCRTVGIAGGPDKCTDCKLYGYDEAIDYKDPNFREAFKAACPDGVDVYFDNVGGGVSQGVHRRLNVGARIVICGQISQYNLERPEPTFSPSLLIVFRARMEGFLISDYAHRFDEAAIRLARWVAEGKIKWREDVTEGLENAPKAFMGMLRGENRGKALVEVADREQAK
jgi:NADPH-dependent curcumin reductase CurA